MMWNGDNWLTKRNYFILQRLQPHSSTVSAPYALNDHMHFLIIVSGGKPSKMKGDSKSRKRKSEQKSLCAAETEGTTINQFYVTNSEHAETTKDVSKKIKH